MTKDELIEEMNKMLKHDNMAVEFLSASMMQDSEETFDTTLNHLDFELISQEVDDYDIDDSYITQQTVLLYKPLNIYVSNDVTFYGGGDTTIDGEWYEVKPVEKTITVFE